MYCPEIRVTRNVHYYRYAILNRAIVRVRRRQGRAHTHAPASTLRTEGSPPPPFRGDVHRRIVRLPCEGPFPCPLLVLALWVFPLSPLPMDFLNIDFLKEGREEQMVY